MPSRLDALRARLAAAAGHDLVGLRLTEFAALLAVAEAAREYRNRSLPLAGQEHFGRTLDTALAALTTEEGDHSPGAGNRVASPNPLLAAAIAALEPDAVCRVEDEHTDTPACLVCRGCALRAVLEAARRAPV